MADRFALVSDLPGDGPLEPAAKIKSFKQDYGAVGDGATDDTDAVNAALAANKIIYDAGDFLTTGLVNDNGCVIAGGARIIQQTDYLKQQINSYADRYQRIFGEEYLSSFHKKLIAGTAVKIILSGDSTTGGEGASADKYKLHNVLAGLTQKHNIAGITYVNDGIGGKSTSDWLSTYLATDLGNTPDVYILRWGINDSSLRTPAAFLANLDTGLATIRGNASFTRDKLAIVLQSQSTSTDDGIGHKGQIFNEAVNDGLRALSRKYHCCYMDIYGMFQDSKNGQDYLSSASIHELIHPQDVFYTWIANRTFDILFPDYFRKSPVNDRGNTAVTSTAADTAFNLGVNYDFVSTLNGFPDNGVLVTQKMNNSGTIVLTQQLFPSGRSNGAYTRICSGGTYQDWSVAPVDRGNNSLSATAAPSTYSNGISYHFVLTGGGFPINGFLTTHKMAFGPIMRQELTSYDSATVMYVRVSYGATFQSWKQVTLT